MNTHSQLCKCYKQNIKKLNLCENQIKCNTIHFLLNLKYDIMRQESFVTEVQESIHATLGINSINIALNTHVCNNNDTIRNIDAYLKCICKHIVIEDYIESGVDENMIKIRYCQICELTFDE